MPLFEFECQVCKSTIEVLQKYSDAQPDHCDKPMKRVMAGGKVALEFKGSGWYKTDYGGDKHES